MMTELVTELPTPLSSALSGQLESQTILSFRWVLGIHGCLVEKYHSPSFWSTDSKNNRHEWRLEVELNGIHNNKNFIVGVKYLGNEEVQLSDLRFQVFEYSTSEIYNDMIQSSKPKSKKNSIPPNSPIVRDVSSLVFTKQKPTYQVQFSSTSYHLACEVVILCRLTVQTVETYANQLVESMNVHSRSLKNEFETLLLHSKFSDITIVVAKKELHLHKCILSNRSSVFAAMFEHRLDGTDTNIVVIEDFTYEVILEFFRYIYTAEVNNIKDCMMELLVAADKYAVAGLKSLCEENMVKVLSPENALEFLCLAKRHNAQVLQDQCKKYIVHNANHVVSGPNCDVSLLPKDLLGELFILLARNFEKV